MVLLSGLTLGCKKCSRPYSKAQNMGQENACPIPDLPADLSGPYPTSLSSAVGQLPHCQPALSGSLSAGTSEPMCGFCIHLLPDFQLDEASDKEFQRTDGRLSLHVTDTQSCFSFTHASVLNHTRNSSSAPQPEPGAQSVLAKGVEV